ncbi:MAG: spondin domain-containing protein [Candidatus Limnocylindrales bacterium]
MDIKRRIPAVAVGSTVLAAAALSGAAGVAAQDMEGEASYRVTIANLAAGQPLTPPLVVLHGAEATLVEAGAPVGDGLQQLAENGDAQVLVDALSGAAGVGSVAVGEHPVVSGGIPGAAEVPSVATIEISGPAEAGLISIASMLICTNDGFSIVHDAPLPAQVGDRATYFSHAYDAGTEINTESFADLVPPCQGLVGVSGEAEGTGATNPDLAEGGVVSPHPGIRGEADLDPMTHAVPENPALIVVERIG